MWDIILDTILDSLKMLPFLFGAYLLIEWIEHKASGKIKTVLAASGKSGPLWGAALGLVPQCGFSVAAANLYAGGVITTGTLIAVMVSTSDEAIPVMLAHPDQYKSLLLLLGTKFVLAIIAGFLAGILFQGEKEPILAPHHNGHEHTHEHCDHCDCKGGIWQNALRHTGGTFFFIVVCMLLLNIAIAWIGEDVLAAFLTENRVLQPFVAALVGFIPNCAASVILTELYLSGVLSFGAAIAGLSTGAGVGLLVLLRTNRNWKENGKILAFLYGFGVCAGLLIQLI